MTSKLAKKVGLKLFEKHLQQYEPADPLYEHYTDEDGNTKRRRKEIPPGLSARDIAILKKVKWRAYHLDRGFSLCGFRFGYTFLIGWLPVVGDVVDAGLNYFLVLRKARQAELPDWLVRKMFINNAVSAVIGFVPIIGDILIGVYKANSRNAALLEEFLRVRGAEFLKAENARVEDPRMIHPGAGLRQGEKVEKRSRAVEEYGGHYVGEAPRKRTSLFGSREHSSSKGKRKHN